MYGRAAELLSRREDGLMNMHAVHALSPETGKKRGVDVHDPAAKLSDHAGRYPLHVTCQNNEIGAMPAQRYNALLSSLLDDLRQVNGTGGYRARLMIVGSELDDPDYLEVIEDQGGLVVTDSICYGTRTMWVDVDEDSADPVAALARYYIQERPSCPRMNGDQARRAKFLQDMIREFHVDGVIGERMLFCDFWCAEHYMNKLDLKEAGVPFLQLDREYITSGKGQLRTRIQAFLETMGK
jgi:benzoyl-CoA reductase/2-hydroxyglutaryl-CoA dehydratase subunit BcrC/BadD/HgdB